MSKLYTVVCYLWLFTLFSCSKHYVNVTKIDIRRSTLASSFAKTPDLRQKHPLKGEQLLVEWNLPSKWNKRALFLELHMIYHDCSEETVRYALDRPRGDMSYFLLGERYHRVRGLMTYDAQVKTEEGEIIQEFKQALFVKIIPLDQED
jgi:hypothetical protein